MAHHRCFRNRLVSLGAGLLLTACGVGSPQPPPPVARAEQTQETHAALPDRFERVLAWGSGPSELTVRRPGHETVARGPTAVGAGPDGLPLVLDQLAGRVVRVGPSGGVQVMASVPVDSEDLAAGPDGALLAYSPLRAKMWVFEPSGELAGEMAVSRVFRDVQAVSLGASRRISLRDGHQSTIPLGSPSVPMPLSVSLRSIEPGAARLPDGRGVIARTDGGRSEVAVLERPVPGERRGEELRHDLPGEATAARIVGADGTIACLRLEQVASTAGKPEIEISRRIVCLDAGTGETTFEQALPRRGLYLPRTELAMGGGRLAFIHPTAEGLRVVSWSVARARTEARKEVSP